MKLYKSITFGLMALALGGSMASCSDFLDEELTTQQNTDYFAARYRKYVAKKVLTSWQ